MKKIVLTGATGFIGKALLNKLVSIYGRNEISVVSSKKIEGIDTILYDASSKVFIDDNKINCEVLIHAGAFTPKHSGEVNLVEEANSNIIFTTNLLNKIEKSKCIKIINLSTLDVYEQTDIISEKTNTNPETLYGMSKLYCEKIVSQFGKNYDIDVLNLRIGHVYGKGEEKYKKIIPIALQKVINDEPIEIYGDGKNLRAFIHIDDVVSTIVSAINRKDIEEKVINVVSENSVDINTVVNMIVENSQKNVQIIYKKIEGSGNNFTFDNTLLKKYLLKEEKNLKEGLLEEYQYMMSL